MDEIISIFIILSACLVGVFKICFLFLKTETLKTYLAKKMIFVFHVPSVLKMLIFREQKKLVLLVFVIA